ncbi:Pentapeptide repeat-containing protein [Flavobacterium sp. CF108]|uniref:pentapeptide repeat-containing protein n=1 Tax=Flavobacterium sp. CF108 TaxID=1882758 RepID=UPI00091D59E8|nr:pentapeptide repeat-containing protein [Flavobacterium sp. CF108]SHH92678.1 Pentapeptide repeat-containing protein [Flavobacterium sp. CF108]
MKYIKSIIILFIIAFSLYIGYNAIFPYNSPEWMGFAPYDAVKSGAEPKKLWDWLDLLIVPLSIATIGWIYKEYEKSKDEKKDFENKQNETLDSYFRVISDLIIKSNLLDIHLNKESKIIARTRTIVAIENLNDERKGQVLQFLYESKLIDKDIIELIGANFRTSEVSGIVLKDTIIKGVYFCNSKFIRSYLDRSVFTACDFTNTDFTDSSMQNTDLSYTKLIRCKLVNIDLTTVDFEGADLTDADLTNSVILKSQLEKIFKKNNIKLNKTKIL